MEEEENGDWLGRVEDEEVASMTAGTEVEVVGVSKEREGFVSWVERQWREVERGRGRGGGGVVEREKREVERGRGKRGENGEKGSFIIGCRSLMGGWQVAGLNVLKEQNQEKHGRSGGRRIDAVSQGR